MIDTPISVTRYTYYIFGGYNNVTFTENCKTTLKDGGKLGFFGGTMPEDLPTPDKSIQQLRKEEKKRLEPDGQITMDLE